MDPVQIGVKMREMRKRAGLTQSEVGAALGVVGATISQYENAKRNIDAWTLTRLAALYKIPVTDFWQQPPPQPVMGRAAAISDQLINMGLILRMVGNGLCSLSWAANRLGITDIELNELLE